MTDNSSQLPEGEEIVYTDDDFIIIKYPAAPNGYVYKVILLNHIKVKD